MKTALLLSLCLATGLITSGCQEETGEERLATQVEAYERAVNTTTDVLCDCWETYGYGSFSQCKNDYGEFLPSTTRCVQRALERDVEASNQYLECIVPLEEEYEACIDSRLACEDADSTDVCSTDYGVGFESCIELPVSIERALGNCFG